MKIPPRAMFWSQVVATAVSGTVQLGVQAWMFTHIPSVSAYLFLYGHLPESCTETCVLPRSKTGQKLHFAEVRKANVKSFRFICPSTEVFGTASIIVSYLILPVSHNF